MVAVATRQRPTPQQADEAIETLLNAVAADSDIFDALDAIRPLHPKNDTFPGEVFMRLAARALSVGGVSPTTPISEEGLVEHFLPEASFRGRNNQKIRYAVLAAAATQAGVEVDLLDEVVNWATDDFWSYAALAATAWIRATAHTRNVPLPEFVERLRHTDHAST